MHLREQLDSEGKDVLVKMAETLSPILDDENNDDLIFFSDTFKKRELSTSMI
jgi:hypothetical protein